MHDVTLTGDTVPVREFEVMTRITGEDVGDVVFDGPGLVVESLLGRYVLDRDAREVWFRVDGSRSAAQIVDAVAAGTGRPAESLRDPVMECLRRLGELALVRYE